jgi:hypothetical protein
MKPCGWVKILFPESPFFMTVRGGMLWHGMSDILAKH